MNEEEYIKERLDSQIEWYDRKSQEAQKWHKRLKKIEVLCAAVIPLLAGLGDKVDFGGVIIGLLGVIIAVCAGVSHINKYQENWLMYRTTCESLKHEKYLFITNSKSYADYDAFSRFVERIEGLISKENSQWSRVTNEKAHNKPIQATSSVGA